MGSHTVFLIFALLFAEVIPLPASCLVEPFGDSVSSVAYPQAFVDNPDAVAVAAPGGFAIVFDVQTRIPLAVEPFSQMLADCPQPTGGSSRMAAKVPILTASQDMAAGDLNGDGIPDAVTIGPGGNVAVFLGNSGGTFQPETDYPAGSGSAAILIVDIDGDSKLDLVIANSGVARQSPGGLSILLGNGDGTFQHAVSFAAGAGPNSVTAGDFNGDGKLDLAVANSGQGGAGNVSVLLANGDGTFKPAVNYTAGTAPWSILAGDWNGDGKPDLAVANFLSGDIAVLPGKGDGTFGPAVRIAIGDSPSYLGSADLNQDGFPDLVALHASHSALSVLLGDGKGGFQKLGSYLAVQSPKAFQFLAWRDNGFVDLLTAGLGAFSLYEGSGDGALASAPLYFVGGFPAALAIADFNMDGQPDIVEASSGSVSLLLGAGKGRFGAPAAVKIPLSGLDQPLFSGIAAGDFNGDGAPDLVVADSDDSRVSVLLGKGDGTFSQSAAVLTGTAPGLIATGDFDRDGNLDVVVADPGFGVVWVLRGDGKGNLQSPRGYPVPNAVSLTVGDFNRDGKPDLAVVNGGDPELGGGNLTILLGKGDGSFQSPVTYTVGSFPAVVAATDLNGDGNLDLAVATSDANSSSIAILLGNGDGTFQAPLSTPTGPGATFIVATDFNGDGMPDLAVAHCCGPLANLTILAGKGDGTFQPEAPFAGGDSPNTIAAADFNGDGLPDLAVAAGAEAPQGTLTILLNNVGPAVNSAEALDAARRKKPKK